MGQFHLPSGIFGARDINYQREHTEETFTSKRECLKSVEHMVEASAGGLGFKLNINRKFSKSLGKWATNKTAIIQTTQSYNSHETELNFDEPLPFRAFIYPMQCTW